MPPFTTRTRVPPITERVRVAPFTTRTRVPPITERVRVAPFTTRTRVPPITERVRVAPFTTRTRVPPITERVRVAPFTTRTRVPPITERVRVAPFTKSVWTRVNYTYKTQVKDGCIRWNQRSGGCLTWRYKTVTRTGSRPELRQIPVYNYVTRAVFNYRTTPVYNYDTRAVFNYRTTPVYNYDTRPVFNYKTIDVYNYETRPVFNYETIDVFNYETRDAWNYELTNVYHFVPIFEDRTRSVVETQPIQTSCPHGYDRDGEVCFRDIGVRSVPATPNCPSTEWTLSNWTCSREAKPVSCPGGYWLLESDENWVCSEWRVVSVARHDLDPEERLSASNMDGNCSLDSTFDYTSLRHTQDTIAGSVTYTFECFLTAVIQAPKGALLCLSDSDSNTIINGTTCLRFLDIGCYLDRSTLTHTWWTPDERQIDGYDPDKFTDYYVNDPPCAKPSNVRLVPIDEETTYYYFSVGITRLFVGTIDLNTNLATITRTLRGWTVTESGQTVLWGPRLVVTDRISVST